MNPIDGLRRLGDDTETRVLGKIEQTFGGESFDLTITTASATLAYVLTFDD